MKHTILRRGAALLLALLLAVPAMALPAGAADGDPTLSVSFYSPTDALEEQQLNVVLGDYSSTNLYRAEASVSVSGIANPREYKLDMSPESTAWRDGPNGLFRYRVYFTGYWHPGDAPPGSGLPSTNDGTLRDFEIDIIPLKVGTGTIELRFFPLGNSGNVLYTKNVTVNITPKVLLSPAEGSAVILNGRGQPVDVSITGLSPEFTGGTLAYEWKNEYPGNADVKPSADGTTAQITPKSDGSMRAVAKVTWTPPAGSSEQPITAKRVWAGQTFVVNMSTDITIAKDASKVIGVDIRNSSGQLSNYEGKWSVVSDGGTGVSATNSSGFNGSLSAAGGKAGDATIRFELLRKSDSAVQFAVDCAVHVTDNAPAPVPVTGVSVTPKTVSVEEGKTASLTAAVTPADADDPTVTWSSGNTAAATVDPNTGVVTGVKEGTAVITATTKDGGKTDTCTVTVTKAAVPVSVTGVTMDVKTLSIVENTSANLTATVEPADAANPAVTWSSSDRTVATVDLNGRVTGVKPGKATITVKTVDGGYTDTCEITVTKTPIAVESVVFAENYIQIDRTDSQTRQISVSVNPADADFDPVEWTSSNPLVATVARDSDTGIIGLLTAVGPGKTIIRAATGGKFAECEVEVSGITLSHSTLTLMVGKSQSLSVTGTYGQAKTSGSLVWQTSDPSVVAVSNGRLSARALGTATITASRGNYTAQCVVTVVEDTSGLIDAGRITAGERLGFDDPIALSSQVSTTIRAELNARSLENTGSTLSYITNLSVRTDQGTIYYNYLSEGDTGSGVGMTSRYYYSAGAGQMPIAKLTYIPKNDYSGYVEISYTGYAANRQSFKGVIRVLVGSMHDVYYSTNAGRHINFRASDFNATCRGLTGRELSYVTFTLPLSSRGTLYYSYTGQNKYTEKVTANTPYRYTSSPSLNNVSFVPADDFTGTFSIIYQGVDSAGAVFSGRVTITVNEPLVSDEANLRFKSERGKQVTFGLASFNDACRAVTGETLDYVRFALPPAGHGTLYHNYRSESSRGEPVEAGVNYMRSGTPTLSGVSFVSTITAPDEVAIDYIGFGTGGSTFVGTVYIELEEISQQTIRYSVESGKPVTFVTDDFNNACRTATGADLNYIRLQLPTSAEGALYYQYNRNTGTYTSRVSSAASYYRTGGNRQVGNITFVAGAGFTGTVTIPYTGYNRSGTSFKGDIVIQVTAPAPRAVAYTGTAASPIRLTASSFRSVCNETLDKELSYIQFTSLPSNSYGRLYIGYSGFNTGTQVNTSMKFYASGSPGIDQLSFVPRGGLHSGTVVIPYTAVSITGQQVNGQVRITISTPSSSKYFKDMAGYRASLASVDYLYENDVTKGMSAGRYGPAQNIRRCDFVLMLCRIYGFNSTISANYPDVPADAYYARAVAAATQLGIVQGNGVGFNPNGTLTRQDAMVIIKNTLTVMGWSTGGNPVDLDGYADSASISGYARNAVGTLVELGIVKPDADGRLRPKSYITRAEVAQILHSVMTM